MTYHRNANEPKVLASYATGISNREIDLVNGFSNGTAAYWLRKNGLTSNVRKGTPPERVDDDHSRCRSCKKVVPNDQFPFVRSHVDGRRLSICRSCRYTQGRKAVSDDPARYFADRENRLARGERGARKARQAIPYELPTGYLHGLWVYQTGLCFYTDRPMRLAHTEGLSPEGASIDRVDPSIGYTVGNVVLCLSRVNLVKHDVTPDEMREWMPGWHTRVLFSLPSLLTGAQPIEDNHPRAANGHRLPSWVLERRERIAGITRSKEN